MNNFDDLFEAQAEDAPEERPFDKDSWVEKKQAERQAVYELADKTTSEVSADGGQYKLFLDVKSRLIHYSATNALLVMAQRPLATQLRDFNQCAAGDGTEAAGYAASGFQRLEKGRRFHQARRESHQDSGGWQQLRA